MRLVVIFGLGVIVGSIITVMISRIRFSGTLRMDQSDPDDKPYLFLELSDSVENVCRHKYVTFKVLVKNYISRK